MKRVFTSACLVIAAWATGAACSSSSQSPATVGDGADSGGSSDAGLLPITEVNGDATSGATMPVMCGGTMCTVPSNGLVPLSPCCLPDNGCGATFGSALAMFTDAAGATSTCVNTAVGTPDPACPSQLVMGMMLSGCCSVSGLCGVDLSAAGLGCNGLSALASLPLGADSSAPQSCSAAGDASVGGGDAGGDTGTD
jgi:hypothetical protein